VSFRIGDKVVYPNHGVATIEEIRDSSLLGQRMTLLCLRVASNDTKVMVPREKTDEVGIRKLIPPKDVRKLLTALRSHDVDPAEDWKGRYQANADLMRTGEIWEVAKVLKGLAVLSIRKELSDRERRMMEKAHYLVVSEIAEVSGLEEVEISKRVERALTTLKDKVAGNGER